MSTRSVIARTLPDIEGGFKGVYHHWDGYPTALGGHLWKLLHEKYKGNLSLMLKRVIDDHSAGWSTLFPGSETGKPECYCHPKRKRSAEPKENWFTHENIESDIEWVYIFDEEANRLFVRDTRADAEVIVDLAGAEPDWLKVTCGEDLERCTHYAWVHFPKMKGSNLSTEVYLGRRPFSFHDAIAVIVKGKRYKMTGSGFRVGYAGRTISLLERLPHPIPPGNAWISTVVYRGKRSDIPTAIQNGDDYEPFPGVTWVFPPTKVEPQETFREGK